MKPEPRVVPILLTLYIAVVFVQSLFFKFTNSPETAYIFETLDAWAAGLGAPGLFAPRGVFSQYVIGSAELLAASLLMLSLLVARRALRLPGAILSMGVISGAIFFHLATPLGVSVLNSDGTRDGGLLFGMACGVWCCAAGLLYLSRDQLIATFARRKESVRRLARYH